MKIHHIINDVQLENGGAQRIVHQLHSNLHGQGLNSQIVALCDSVEGLTDATSLDNPTPYSYRSFFSVLNYIRKHCAADDIIHVHLFPSLLYVAIAAKLLGWKGHLVCTEHNTNNRRRQHPVGSAIDRLIYPMYQQIYCISQGTYSALESWMPSQKAKLKVLENGVALSYASFLKRDKKEKLIIASAGRLHEQKNYETAIRAIAQLDSRHNIEYRIAGIGPKEAALKALAAELNLSNTVKFYGYVEDIFGFFAQADIFLMPSKWEGFGLAAVEAMNTGLPVIASNLAGIKEILETTKPCGLLVSPSSPDDIADAVRILSDYDKRLLLGRAAFVRSLDFSTERMSEQYARDYRQLGHPHLSLSTIAP